MANERVEKPASWLPQIQAKTSQFAVRPFAVQSQTPTQQEIEPQAFSNNQPSGTKMLEIPNFFGPRTPASAPPIQTKLTIGEPGDRYEQEADRVASQVVKQINSPEAAQSTQGQSVQRQEESEEEIQAKQSISELQRSLLSLEVQREDMSEEDDLQAKSILQRQEEPEEEIQAKQSISDLQRSPLSPDVQREDMSEEEDIQAKSILQRQEEPEEEIQAKQSISDLQRSPLSSEVQREAMPEEEDIQAKSILQRQEAIAGGEATTDLDSAINSARGGGQSLDAGLQRSMGQAMGADFSGVKVHTDAQSDQLNQSIQAKAFTTGQDVFFRQGAYEPGSRGGQELIAHELTHVVQQNGGAVQRSRELGIQRQIDTQITSLPPISTPVISRKPDGTTGRLEEKDIENLESFLKHNNLSVAWSTYPQIQKIYEQLKGANTQLLNQAGRSSSKKNKYREKVQQIYTRIVQETTQAPIKTWDAKAKGGNGAFVNSDGAYNPGNQTEQKDAQGRVTVPETNSMGYATGTDSTSDGRNFKNIDSSPRARQRTIETLNQVTQVEDIDNLDISVIQSIDPMSLALYRILHDVLHQSWHMAKETLANGSEKRQAFMKKLWEYRQWHHDQVLQETQKEVTARTKNPKGLEKWPSAGSTTLTSDIDVNLKGERTEVAVEVFNELFKKGFPGGHSWDYEAGVVYDVNVYAVDFMHSFAGIETGEVIERLKQDQASYANEDAAITEQVPVKRTVKEGKRSGQDRGGISDRELDKLDRANQSESALVKVRLYMTGSQWEAYKESVKLPPDQKNLWQNVEQRYSVYLNTMSAKITEKAQGGLQLANQAEMTGMQVLQDLAAQAAGHSGNEHIDSAKQEQLIIGSSNRIYEEKLKEVAMTREELKNLITAYNEMAKPETNTPQQQREAQEEQINISLTFLRNLIAECGLYANEASITDATVHHGVVGLQGGGKINMTQADALNAVNEHMGDALKEIERHGHGGDPNHLGEAIFKAGKYMWRLADAAKNMGHGGLAEVERLYEAGYAIAEVVKGSGNVTEQEGLSMTIFQDIFPYVENSQDLAQLVIRVGTRITNAHHLMQKFDEKTSDKLTQATPAKKTINTNM